MNEYVDFQNALALAIASGIGGDGEMMIQETLWEGKADTTGYEITLNKKITDFDLVAINYGTVSYSDSAITTSLFITKNDNEATLKNRNHRISYGAQNSTILNRYIDFYMNDNKLVVGSIETCAIYKVIGIKFTGTKLIDYSTEEQVIGKWIDGKPLYRKVFPFDTTVTINSNSYAEVPINVSYIEKIIDNTVFSINFVGVRKNVAVQVHSTNKTIYLYNFSSASTTSGGCMIEYTKSTD